MYDKRKNKNVIMTNNSVIFSIIVKNSGENFLQICKIFTPKNSKIVIADVDFFKNRAHARGYFSKIVMSHVGFFQKSCI